jgi:REP element-mobilizing transposase RayT
MPQSLSYILIHVIFSTKDRTPYLADIESRQRLHAYLATVARDHDCECFCVGGVADHVHLAVRLARTVTVAKLVEHLKSSSSKWLKDQHIAPKAFAWQRGYAAFSVSPRDLPTLRRYIETQAEHHTKHSFQDELRAFLIKYGVDFDERYVWD